MARIRPRTEVKSGPATVSGASAAPILGSGTPQASAGTTSGSGFRVLSSSGVLVPSSSIVSGGSGDAYVSGAFHYDPINGSDSNNGIPSGETGSGATLNGTAGTGARQTVGQLQTDLESGRYRPGDLIYLNPGTWAITSGFTIVSNSTSLDASNKLVIRSLPGERDNTIIDTNANGESSMLFGGLGVGPIHFLESNIVIQSFTVRYNEQVFSSGNGSGSNGDAYGCQWLDIVGDRVGSPHLGDNGGFWKIESSSEDFLIAGCYVPDQQGNTSNNEALVYYIGTIRGTIEYNYFLQNGPGATIHHKRSIGVATQGDIRIAKNFLIKTGSGRNTFWGAGTARHTLTGNIHRGPAPGFGASGNASTMDPPCFENLFEHETFYNGGFETNEESSSIAQSGEDNTVRSCLLGGGWTHWRAQSLQNTGLTSNYNHGDGSGTFITYFNTAQSLAAWQGRGTGDTGQDANSVDETPNYLGTPDASDPTTYRLAAGSAGKNAAHDGADIGADVDDCGPDAMSASYLWLNGTTKVAA